MMAMSELEKNMSNYIYLVRSRTTENILTVAGYPYEWLSKFLKLRIFSEGCKRV